MKTLTSYSQYESRPRILKGEEKDKLEIPKENVFDLASHTFLGLVEDLCPGSELMERFLQEQEEIMKGEWIYYPRKNHLVKFAPRFWHRLALLVRNSTLFRDPEMKMSWQEIRDIFEKAVVAVTGCSVGNSAIYATVEDLRPLHIKIADPKDFRMPNANRVRLSYEDFGRNKAIVTAEQIHALDPFMQIAVFTEGIHGGNVKEFVAGNQKIYEPPATIIIEEMDDPDMKILIREEARRYKVPVVMVTDMGSAVQLDVRRFDIASDLPLAACGVSDDELYERRNQWQKDLADQDKFYAFAFALIGHHYHKTPEFKRIVFKEDTPLFGGIPQLGSTVMVGGGIIAEAIARLLLGFKLSERMFIHKYTGETIIEGERL